MAVDNKQKFQPHTSSNLSTKLESRGPQIPVHRIIIPVYRTNYTVCGLIIRRVKYQRRQGVPKISKKAGCSKNIKEDRLFQKYQKRQGVPKISKKTGCSKNIKEDRVFLKYQRRQGVPKICTQVGCQYCTQTSRQNASILFDVWERRRMSNERRT